MSESPSRKQGLIWGGLLIVFGLIGLLDSFTNLSLWIWVAAMAVSGLGVLAVYFADQTEWWPLIPAYILIALSIFVGAVELEILRGALIAPVVLTVAAIPFLIVYFRDRSQWWPLIPAYVLLLIAAMVALIETGVLVDAWTATFILGGIGLPFLVVYLRDRKNWWALIPAYVMFAVGLMVGLIDNRVLQDSIIPAYVLLSIALPFFVVYATDTSRWWPLIPGGVLAMMGVIFLMTGELLGFVVPILIIIAGVLVLGSQFFSRSPGKETESPEEGGG